MEFECFRACSFERETPGELTEVFDMQLMPHPMQAAFSVYSQKGHPAAVRKVKGELCAVPLVHRTLCEHVSLQEALLVYDRGYRSMRVRVGVVETALRRESSSRNAEVRAAVAKAAEQSFDGSLFTWDAHLQEMVSALEDMLDGSAGNAWLQGRAVPYSEVALLMLAEVCQAFPEGPSQLVPQFNRLLDSIVGSQVVERLVYPRLSDSTLAALRAQPHEKVARQLLARAIVDWCERGRSPVVA